MKKYFLLLIVSLLFTSCKSYIQIYDVDSTSAKTSNEQFVFENEDCKLTYNFWEEWGNASMVFTNKTDKNLFVSLSQSSYIFNGFSSSFYKGVDDHVIISKLTSKTFHDLPIVCVAPKSSRVIGDLNLVDKIYFFCEKRKISLSADIQKIIMKIILPLNLDIIWYILQKRIVMRLNL